MLAPSRVTGLGGAYIGEAEGVEGSAVNSAAPAVRDPFSEKWLDFDLALSASFLGAFAQTDFDNHGSTPDGKTTARTGDFIDLNFGGNIQLGYFGASATGDLQSYSLTSTTPGASSLTMEIGRWKGLAAFGFAKGQLVIGSGLRVVTLQVLQQGGGTLLAMTGFGPEIGALLMPDGHQYRIGVTLRDGVSGSSFGNTRATVDAEGNQTAGRFILPQNVVMPWEVEAGFAYQLGPRPLNPTWQNPVDEEEHVRLRIREDRESRAREYMLDLARTAAPLREARRAELLREEAALRDLEDARLAAEAQRLYQARKARYDNWPRERILLLASVLVTGPSQNAVSLEGFLDQRHELVGLSTSITPRVGLEGEPINNRLRARVGSYIEPSRYTEGFPRQHFTFGGDVKLFPFDFWGLLGETTWKIGFYVDMAPRYSNGGLSISTWH